MFNVQLLFCFPVLVIFEVDVPDGTAVFHEGRRHIADSLDGSDIAILHSLVDCLALNAGKESVETVLIG